MKYKPKASNSNTSLVSIYGIQFVVQYDYSPAEPMTWWEPGCDEEYDVWEVKPATIKDAVMMEAEELTEVELKSTWFVEMVVDKLVGQHDTYKRQYPSDD